MVDFDMGGILSDWALVNMSGFAAPWQIQCERADGTLLRVFGSGPSPTLEQLLQEFLSCSR